MKTFIVIALDADHRNLIKASLMSLESLKSQEIEVEVLPALGELPAILKKFPTSGILLELATSIKASHGDKEATNTLIALYPYAKCKVVGTQVMVLGNARSLEEFGDECLRFNPRTIRREIRRTRYIAIYLSADDTFQDAEKVVTINISQVGCFIYSVREWTVGARVWLRLIGKDDAFCGTVFSWMPWGNDQLIPGIGVKLDVELIWP